jgi:hypothetical protein
MPYINIPTYNKDEAKMKDGRNYKLYSIAAIVVASFIGSVLAGAVLMAINYHRLRRRFAAWVTIATSVCAVALIDYGYRAMPSREIRVISSVIILLTLLMVIGLIAAHMQGKALIDHHENGGKLECGWKTLGISLLVIAVGFGWRQCELHCLFFPVLKYGIRWPI